MGARGCALLALVLTLSACGSGSGPKLSLTAPRDGAEVYGLVRLEARATHGQVAAVAFYLDRADAAGLIGQARPDADGLCGLDWLTGGTTNGTHTLIAATAEPDPALEASATVVVANRSRQESIPAGAVKQTPQLDPHPPVLEPAFQALYEDCVPLPGPVNTAGAEDSPYVSLDGQELYLFFTPDPTIPAEQQLGDRVTGIYRARRDGDGWGEPERVWLSHTGEPALDGCETVYGDQLWFCSARVGNLRAIDIFVAERRDGLWLDWTSAGERLNLELEVGELHLADAGRSLYYHSERAGGQGGVDLWLSRLEDGGWSDAVNLTAVNSVTTDGWPWVSQDEQELWLTRGPAAPELWRSLEADGGWQAPEKVVGPFAGEATFDPQGNLYFTHHFWDDQADRMIEADIYVCRRR